MVRRALISVAVLAAVVLALAIGLVYGLRSRNHNNNNTSDFAETWNSPSEFVLSKNFSITHTPTTRTYDWTISQQTIAPDGLERPMLLVNGMFPGPLIEANTGDRIVVKVTNNMVNGTAIHWHGMFQNGTNWMDGTMGVTQCAIPPGQSFTYNFTVPNQWGTYWWHAHSASQYVDGIVGPLIIHSPDEPHLDDYQEDIIMMISDYYHTDSGSLVSWYLSVDSEGTEPIPDNGLINGRHSWDCSLDAQALFPTDSKCTPGAPMSVFEFMAGTTYRVRIINTGAFADFQFSIDNHTLSVIEADGVDMQPVIVQRIPIHVAQRYSVLVHANQSVGNYWVRATMNTECFNAPNPALDEHIKAIIHYAGAPTIQQADSVDWGASGWSPTCVDLSLEMLKPYFAQPAPNATVQIHIATSFQTVRSDHVNLGYVNGTSWTPLMNDTTLYQAQKSITAYDASQLVVTLNSTGVVELVINNYDEGAHPFHFHGHNFYVLGWGGGNYIPGKSPLELTNPLRRDTSTVPSFGYTVIRFVNDNPGLWALHCHIEWHMEAGLMMQIESLPQVIKTFEIPPEMPAMCAFKSSP
ncbi:Cupredoxin [Gamsiella multidivaricata]|uniref:Cupredoxin n=1 Tax=Gamsiella multidivaricata TaxID=101098 RepID=UPI00221F134D|nr:Cupredoxin [Gamsiella multidivaricata]KAI7832414.1 Cupredoxin [Gamsiella multidivaricata]